MKVIKVKGRKNIFALIVCILIPELVGVLSAFLTKDTYREYANLIKPDFSPPGWVFPIVWTILYFLMGIASYRIFMLGTQNPKVKKALFFYGLQLFFNFFWPILFFGLGLRGFAFVELIVLWVLILITFKKFYKLDAWAGYLLIPYIIWVAFAGILNFFVWKLNQ
ncbi:TspO/MBR family protein [Inediibacterium massiliense]|uniref:TspO/MBR family protein n=1 Tax=Inediibacterium massiliense TaxID=1658111 RepID=UPI0006B69A03|nr:TspO/MBR family protein [Inediibacterium massiliense]